MEGDMNETRRRAIFAALVAAQDRGLTVADSRKLVADQFGVTPGQVKSVELEGERKQWPPLGE
jgi:hypothetical protein